MELAYPLKTKTLEVNGCLTGQIFCTGTVRIHKGGILRGSLEARSLAVDRGGTCEAFTKIVSSPTAEEPQAGSLIGRVSDRSRLEAD
jgi:cytoskeletal protein CcmA (bactofilin family)